MKKRKRTVSFTSFTFILIILSLLVFISLSLGQEENKYPPYPDVWEREFTDYLGRSTFFPATDGEVIIDQFLKVDRNGNVMRDKQGNLLSSVKPFLFFENKVVTDFKKEIEWRVGKGDWFWGKSSKFFGETHSKDLGLMSKEINLKDEDKVKWIRGIVTDGYGVYEKGLKYERREVNGVLLFQSEAFLKIDDTPHGRYYNRPILLEKVDKDGEILWQKVYLYFHPWWKHDVWIYDRYTDGDCDDSYSFYYFKLGHWAVIDKDKIFLYFDGTKKIFRLPEDGNPRTEDKNIVVMDYKEYREMVEGIIKRIHNFRWGVGRNISINPCCISIERRKPPLCTSKLIGDYDYIGEQLSKRFGMGYQSDLVKKIMGEHRNLDKCINNYRQMEKSN